VVKGIGWNIQRTNWSADEGIRFEIPTVGIKEQIERNLKTNNEHDLGNAVRRYSERLLKEIAEQLEVPMAFRFNERNEGRMFEELYSALKGRIGKKTSKMSKMLEFTRLGTCQFLSNKASHDSGYNSNLADMKAAYLDLLAFEGLFQCGDCKKLVSLQFIDVPGGKVSCKCGAKKLPWRT